MNDETIERLKNRNTRIINAILKKINICCPNSVDIIGIAGSFATKRFDDLSDLDLCIISNNSDANCINKCFIIDNIGFDIYCSPWEKMEKMAEYKTPYVAKLMNLEIVFSSGQLAKNKYYRLREELQKNLTDKSRNHKNAKIYFDKAFMYYSLLILSEEPGKCLMNLYLMITNVESGLFIINGGYVKGSIKDIPKELFNLNNLPVNFNETYDALFRSKDIEDMKIKSTDFMQSVNKFYEKVFVKSADITTVEKIIGTYEEIFSNWKNKVIRAEHNSDSYSQFMAIASCQNFYNEMNLIAIDVLKDFSFMNLKNNTKDFLQGMKEWSDLYKQTNTSISRYKCVDEFEDDYLKQFC